MALSYVGCVGYPFVALAHLGAAHGNVEHVSLERLVQCMSRLGYDIEIVVSRKPRSKPV